MQGTRYVSNLDSALTFLCMGSGWAASRASSDCSGNRRTAHCEVGHCHPSVARKSSMKACGSSCGSILVSMMWAGSVVVTGAAAGVPVCWTILQSTCWSSAWVWRNAWKLCSCSVHSAVRAWCCVWWMPARVWMILARGMVSMTNQCRINLHPHLTLNHIHTYMLISSA